MKSKICLILALGAACTLQVPQAFAQNQNQQQGTQEFTAAAEQAQQRLETAQQEYARLQEEIAPQKAELGAELAILEERLRTLQQEFSNTSRISQTLDVEVNQLQSRIGNLGDTNSYIQQTLINEYLRRFELTLNPAERDLYNEDIRAALESVDTEEGVDVSDARIFERQIRALQTALQRTENSIGGYTTEGSAITADEVHEGRFALFGPLTYFSSENNVGIVNGMRGNTLLPEVYLLPEYAEPIRALVDGEQASIPVDTTGNSRSGALQSLLGIDASLSLWEEWQAGGVVMIAILGLFAAAILVAIFKFFELMSVKQAKESDLQTVLDRLREGDREGALNHAKSIGGPAGALLTNAVEHSEEDKEVIEEVIYETIVKTQPKLDRFLAFIAVTAATAPLLGLLGTVTGMIKTFKLITIVGTGDAQSLSSGISEALITTKWGLIVAIPTLIAHTLLNRKAKGVIGSMEQTGVGFINGIVEIRESKRPAA